MALKILSDVTKTFPDIFRDLDQFINANGDSHSNDGDLVATGRQAGTAAVATGVLALATIAMITEFIVYSGFSPRVKIVFMHKRIFYAILYMKVTLILAHFAPSDPLCVSCL